MKFFQRLRPGTGNNKATLKAIFITSGAGQPMHAVDFVYASCDRGLQGDRYHDNTGHWKATDACQVTLITEHELRLARKRTALNLDNGCHRRNLVVDGISPGELEDKQFSIGGAVFGYHKRRPPCGYIDSVEDKGLGRALGKGSGLCLKVIESGIISTGDPLTILTDCSRH